MDWIGLDWIRLDLVQFLVEKIGLDLIGFRKLDPRPTLREMPDAPLFWSPSAPS